MIPLPIWGFLWFSSYVLIAIGLSGDEQFMRLKPRLRLALYVVYFFLTPLIVLWEIWMVIFSILKGLWYNE